MSDTTTTRTRASKTAADMPMADTPGAFSAVLDKSLARAKDAHEKMSEIVQNTTEAFEEAFNCANKGSNEYRLKMLEIARAHTNAAFDLALGALAVKSPTELVELSADHTRKRFDLAATHMQELATLTQKVMNETTAPIRQGMTEPFKLAS